MGPPIFTVAGPVLVTARSVCSEETTVLADAELLAGLGWGWWRLPGAVWVMVPGVAGAVTLIVNVALAPLARLPAVQVTVPDTLVQPALAETKVTPAGRVLVTFTPVAGLGPLLVAVTV